MRHKHKLFFYTMFLVPLMVLSCVHIKVDKIKFNHNISGSNDDALNIRKNISNTVDVPEWTSGETNPVNSQAAYVGNRNVKVKATFRANRDGVYTIYTKGGPFRLKPTRVRIKNGVSDPLWVTFESTLLPKVVNVSDVKWRWKRKLWWIFGRQIDVSYHRFYIVLDEPNEPWQQSPYPDSQNPWTKALDFSCHWAAGGNTLDSIAEKIAEHVNAGPYSYDMNAGGTHYGLYNPRRYNLTAFLDRLNGGWGNGSIVNCSDCGMSTTIFSNLLGTQLWSSRMGSGFALNEIVPVGYTTFGCPNWGCSFSYHEVAWEGNAQSDDEVHDACLKVDGDLDPANSPHTPLLPVNMRFDDPTGMDYRERLVPPSSLANCQAQPNKKVQPPVY